ncbi:hypothetical protein HGRIS_001002 [Hohenbuehelia grisea]|uniref:Uncharacterized protein n=1 Tax=Hohenbuehelia grisea TaxID=104357 RepID=A0ABR3IQE9_9AGAR
MPHNSARAKDPRPAWSSPPQHQAKGGIARMREQEEENVTAHVGDASLDSCSPCHPGRSPLPSRTTPGEAAHIPTPSTDMGERQKQGRGSSVKRCLEAPRDASLRSYRSRLTHRVVGRGQTTRRGIRSGLEAPRLK